MPAAAAMQVWYDRLRPLWHAASYDLNPVRSAMLSAYLQGAMDSLYIAERHSELLKP